MFLRKFPALSKTFGSLMPDLEKQKIPQTLLKNFDTQIADYGLDAIDVKPADLLKEFNIDKIQQTSNKFYTFEKTKRLTTDLENLIKSSKNPKIANKTFKNFLNDRIRILTQGHEEYFRHSISRLKNDLYQSSEDLGVNVFQDFLISPQKAEKKYAKFNLTEKDIFLSLAQKKAVSDEHPMSKFLVSLGKAYKKMDDIYLKDFENLTTISKLKDFVVPLKFDKKAVLALGPDELTRLFQTHTNLITPQKIVDKILNSALSENPIEAQRINFISRKIQFKSLEDEFLFNKALNQPILGSSVLKRALDSKEKLAQKAFIFKEFGPEPEKTITNLFHNYRKTYKIDLDTLNKQKESVLTTLKMSQGIGFYENSSFRLYTEALDSFTSAIYGGTKSLLRQSLIDTSGHPTAFKGMFFNQNTTAQFFLERWYNPLKFLFANAKKQVFKDRSLREELNKYLYLFNLSSSDNALFRSQGFSFQQVLGTGIEVKDTPGQRIGHYLHTQANRLNEVVHKFSGNMAHYDSVEAMSVFNNSRWFSEMVLNTTNFNSFSKEHPQILTYLNNFYNIGEKEYSALRALRKIPSALINQKPTQTSKLLGFNQELNFLTPSSIDKMPLNIAKKFLKKGETPEQFKKRLKFSYFQFLLDYNHYGQPRLSRASRVVERGLKRGTFADLLLRMFTKFWNITHTQATALQKGINISLYGNPYEVGLSNARHNTEFLKSWAKAFSWYMGPAILLLWLKDLLAFRTPRNLTPETLLLTAANSGIGGIPASLLAQVLQTRPTHKPAGMIHSQTPFGSFFNQAAGSLKSPYAFARFAQTSSGLGKLWYADGLINQLLQQALLEPNDIKALDAWYEKTLGTSLLFRY